MDNSALPRLFIIPFTLTVDFGNMMYIIAMFAHSELYCKVLLHAIAHVPFDDVAVSLLNDPDPGNFEDLRHLPAMLGICMIFLHCIMLA